MNNRLLRDVIYLFNAYKQKKRKLRKVFVKFYLASIINLIAVLSSPSMAIS